MIDWGSLARDTADHLLGPGAWEAARHMADRLSLCPLCDSTLESRSCKLVCTNKNCPYIMDCSDA